MKLSHLGLSAVIMTALLSYSLPQANAAPVSAPALKPTLTSKSEGFSIWLPGKPEVNQEVSNTKELGKMTIKYYVVATPSVAYVVLPMILPASISPGGMNAYLVGVQSGFTQTKGAKLVSSKNITLDGVPGRELVVNVGDNQIRARFYAIGKKSYQLMATTPQKGAPAQAAQIAKVLNSFHILK